MATPHRATLPPTVDIDGLLSTDWMKRMLAIPFEMCDTRREMLTEKMATNYAYNHRRRHKQKVA
jgi:hypothetical protein